MVFSYPVRCGLCDNDDLYKTERWLRGRGKSSSVMSGRRLAYLIIKFLYLINFIQECPAEIPIVIQINSRLIRLVKNGSVTLVTWITAQNISV